uniref:Uncharacterized protein n=1 Tax=Timema douglasi TaxID=61478 RepID=A0A7R8VBZ0_TIMDO|nr:unnamed protein product [Timema douglasi]
MASRIYSTCFKTIFDNLAIKHNFNGFEVMRYYGRWVHRKPLRVINPEDNHSQSTRNEKLSIEKQFLKYQPKNKEINDECNDNDPSTLEDNLNNNKHSNYQEESEIIELEPQTQFSSSASKSLKSLSKTKRVELTYKQKASFNAIKMKASAEKHCVPLFSKLNDSDPKFSNIMTLVKSKNKREKGKLILLEGKRLIADAILSGFPLQMVFFSRLSDLKNLNLPSFGVQVYKLPYKTLSLWSDVSTSPGIVVHSAKIRTLISSSSAVEQPKTTSALDNYATEAGIMKIPPVDKKMPGPEDLPLTILCDNIREPGNLGTILRTAAAVGCHQVLLTKVGPCVFPPHLHRLHQSPSLLSGPPQPMCSKPSVTISPLYSTRKRTPLSIGSRRDTHYIIPQQEEHPLFITSRATSHPFSGPCEMAAATQTTNNIKTKMTPANAEQSNSDDTDMESDTDGQGTFTLASKLTRKWNNTNVYFLRDGLKTHTTTKQNFDLMQNLLKDLKQEYHTYSLPRDKPVHVVVKGLPLNMLTEDLQ